MAAAKTAALELIAVLSTPIPEQFWEELDTKDRDPYSWSELIKSADDPLRLMKPWKAIARRLEFDPRGQLHAMLRSVLQVLLAAEALDDPYVWVGAVATTYPTLSALSYFMMIVSRYDPEKGSWLENYSKATSRTNPVFIAAFAEVTTPKSNKRAKK